MEVAEDVVDTVLFSDDSTIATTATERRRLDRRTKSKNKDKRLSWLLDNQATSMANDVMEVVLFGDSFSSIDTFGSASSRPSSKK